jgi:stearoyl-CoA desaturase (delta-9 desaturase)
MSLMRKFYTDPYFLPRYFMACLLAHGTLCAMLYALHSSSFYRFHFTWAYLFLIPLGLYAGGLSVVFMHNASHGSFLYPWLNWFCGHLAGMHQLWGFLNFQLGHLFHHQYSDNPDRDIHHPGDKTFWHYALTMWPQYTTNMNKHYVEHWGSNFSSRCYTVLLQSSLFALIGCNLLFWNLLLGPGWFLFFYLPSYIGMFLVYAVINYFGHSEDPVTGIFAPCNLDNNWLYRLGNVLLFGVFYHANHHRRPLLFNPAPN